ncbi:GIY-YIG nuclease family protein [Sediminicola luteus]|uniref:GIY-YIG domain-containing protein n=1 Tax=Sediminicola luteus TaxID=319238 RepID=A0A2A4GD30_9FLAO|nr:GIY-YIG nuclease family protein [Sediminicola luteus]PCE65888.1 hypothetical protein B7P33_00890 [Sediminicola luteus]
MYLYILFSPSTNKYYTGISPNPGVRTTLHNSHHFKGAYTKIAVDWHIVLTKEFPTRRDAQFIESFIKRMKSKTFIQKIIENPVILDDILSKR